MGATKHSINIKLKTYNINKEDITMTQQEILNLINTYNSTERKVIKAHLKRIMKEKKLKLRNIVELGYNRHNAASWTNSATPNIPLFPQALHMATEFDFDVRELIKVV